MENLKKKLDFTNDGTVNPPRRIRKGRKKCLITGVHGFHKLRKYQKRKTVDTQRREKGIVRNIL